MVSGSNPGGPTILPGADTPRFDPLSLEIEVLIDEARAKSGLEDFGDRILSKL